MVEWDTSCPDWERRIVARLPLIPAIAWYPEAEIALRIFKRLIVADIPGKPTLGEICEDWIFDFVRAVFGAYDDETKARLVQDFFLLVAKKNAKSTIAAGIMLTALIRNRRDYGEYLIIAPTKEIADNSFIPALGMIKSDPELNKLFHGNSITREIENKLTKATLSVKAADADVVGGQKAIGVLVDELWLFGKKVQAENILSEATGSMASRPEGFVIYLSTQSDDPPAGVFRKKLHYHRRVRDGLIKDSRSIQAIYEFPAGMLKRSEWKDPQNFYIPNPNLGRSVSNTFLVSAMLKANEGGKDSVRLFNAKHLNVEVGIGSRSDHWVGADHWLRRADKRISFRSLFKLCDVIVPGIDGGGLDDLFGLSLLGRHKITKDWLLWSHAWCHEGVLERRQSIATQLLTFRDAGDLTIVNDELADISRIVRIIKMVKDKGLLGGVAVDPAGLGEFVEALAEIDITTENKLLIGAPQGYGMMNAIKTCERKLASGTLRHAPSTMMDWCVGNLKIEPTATAIRATKQNAGDAKIDPVMAMFDSAVLMATNPEATGTSVLKRRGLLVL